MMETQRKPNNRLADELESIRLQIAEIQSMVSRNNTSAAGAPDKTLTGAIVSPMQNRELGKLFPPLPENAPFGMALIDSDCRFVRVNRVACQILEYLDQELLGLTLGEITLEEDAADCLHLFDQVWSGRLPYGRMESQFYTKSRETVRIRLTVCPLYEYSEKQSLALAFLENLAERGQAEEDLKTGIEVHREIFENTRDIVFAHDLAGNITFLNKSAEKIIGCSRGQMIGSNYFEWVAPEMRDQARKIIAGQIAGKGDSVFQLDVIAKDGRRVFLEISSHPVFREGKPVAIQGIARDITSRKKTEEELSLKNQKLQEWVGELEKRACEMTLLSDMGDMLRACLTTSEAYSVIVSVAQQIFPVQMGTLYIIDKPRNVLEAVASWGETPQAVGTFIPHDCWGLRRGKVHWVEDRNSGPLCRHLNVPAPEGYICIPMMAQSQAIGVLFIEKPPNEPFHESKKQLALAMAEHIAMALSNLKLHETLRSQSIRDPLTGLFNQNFMEESLELELRRSVRSQRPLGIIMIQVDNAELIRLTFGQDAEDCIIRELAKLLQRNIRKEDIGCRLGDSKFVVILPQGDAEVCPQRAENLMVVIRNLDVTHCVPSVGRITASMGIATYPDQGRTVETLIRAAEAAVQRAGEAGGNSIVTAK
jgi:diguanylate cyclase (GGDEF)-like protein/PAS domain S-box-containing protein